MPTRREKFQLGTFCLLQMIVWRNHGQNNSFTRTQCIYLNASTEPLKRHFPERALLFSMLHQSRKLKRCN